MTASGGGYWLPRSVHPLAWWLWALGLAVAASRTTNPLLLGAILATVSWVVLARRSDAPWANAFRLYVIGGLLVVGLRVFFRIIFGGDQGDVVVLHLPAFSLAGLHLFGDVTAESLLGGLYDGLRLATMLICLGAANALANPRRLLRTMPPALHEVSTAVVVALSVFPQLAESVVRVRRARRLRPGSDPRGVQALRTVMVPVLEDALDRSLLLAAAMDSRGYGRVGAVSAMRTRLTGGLLVTGLAGICVGAYAVLDGSAPPLLASPMLVLGVAAGVVGVSLSGRGVTRSSYRPEHWGLAELCVAASGLTAATLVHLTSQVAPAVLNPTLNPVAWPEVTLLPVVGIVVGVLPAVATPLPVDARAAMSA
jgi:energy-coupling factor transport system permease protein